MNNNSKVEDENFPCEYCDAVFEKPHLHRKHMKNHVNETKKKAGARDQREFRCRFCDLPFDKPQALGGHMNCHHDERAKEKIKNVVNMYGMNNVQTLIAQMPRANAQGQTQQAIRRPFEMNMHGHPNEGAILQDPTPNFHMIPHHNSTTQNMTYPSDSNTWQPQRQRPLQQQQQQHIPQGPQPQYSQQPTTIGFAQQSNREMLSWTQSYLRAQPGAFENQQYPLPTNNNIGSIGPSNKTPYTHAHGGFEIQRPRSTRTPNSNPNTMFNMSILQEQQSGGHFEPGSYLLEQGNEGDGVVSSSSIPRGYRGIKRKPRDD